jgi:hypothetical protein
MIFMRNNQPIADRINEVKRMIKKSKDEKEDLEQQLSQLYDEAKVLIDLHGKLWVFLELQRKKSCNQRMTILYIL